MNNGRMTAAEAVALAKSRPNTIVYLRALLQAGLYTSHELRWHNSRLYHFAGIDGVYQRTSASEFRRDYDGYTFVEDRA